MQELASNPYFVLPFFLTLGIIGQLISRTIYIRRWIKSYCSTLDSALPKPDPVPILRTPKNCHLEFTWDRRLWHRKEVDRMVIITAAALDAFNDYYNFFNLKDKALLYVSTKAIKKMSFHHGPMSTCCSSPQWGVEIAITYTDKVPEKEEPKKKCITMEDLWVNERPEEDRAPLPIPSRYIVVCKDV